MRYLFPICAAALLVGAAALFVGAVAYLALKPCAARAFEDDGYYTDYGRTGGCSKGIWI